MGRLRDHNRCRDRLEALAGADLDAEEARYEAVDVLHHAIAFERWCWPLTDPGSALSTSGIGEVDFWPSLSRMVALEEHGDITTKQQLVAGPLASVALGAVTGGDLARSERWQECLRPYGIGDQLVTACRDRHGCWGTLELMRDRGDSPFEEDEVRLLNDLALTLGTLLRRSAIQAWRGDVADRDPRPPGTMILAHDLQPTSWTAPFHGWLDELPSASIYKRAGMLPTAVHRIAARVLAPPDHSVPKLPARARIRTHEARWSVLEGAVLQGADSGQVVITARAANPDEIFDLLCKASDFTRRERELVVLMLHGLSTSELSQALCISPHTVTDHLKAVFEKTGVRSRREVISQLAGGARGGERTGLVSVQRKPSAPTKHQPNASKAESKGLRERTVTRFARSTGARRRPAGSLLRAASGDADAPTASWPAQ